jgi:hypothetical protein
MKKFKYSILFAITLLAGCATQDKLQYYGKMPNKSYIIAQMCIKDKDAEIENTIRYSVLFKNNNAIRKFEENTKYNGNYFYSVPLGEPRNLTGFLLPLEYQNLQYFGFMWDFKKISPNSSKWTDWLEPGYTVKDISDTSFKVDNGIIGREEKSDSTTSPYLVRFRVMDFEDYIRNHLEKWKKDPIPKCE